VDQYQVSEKKQRRKVLQLKPKLQELLRARIIKNHIGAKVDKEIKRLYIKSLIWGRKLTFLDLILLIALPMVAWPVYFKYRKNLKSHLNKSEWNFYTKGKNKGNI
jgi:hypothetical protein